MPKWQIRVVAVVVIALCVSTLALVGLRFAPAPPPPPPADPTSSTAYAHVTGMMPGTYWTMPLAVLLESERLTASDIEREEYPGKLVLITHRRMADDHERIRQWYFVRDTLVAGTQLFVPTGEEADAHSALYERFRPMVVDKYAHETAPTTSDDDMDVLFSHDLLKLPGTVTIKRETAWELPGGNVRLLLLDGEPRSYTALVYEAPAQFTQAQGAMPGAAWGESEATVMKRSSLSADDVSRDTLDDGNVLVTSSKTYATHTHTRVWYFIGDRLVAGAWLYEPSATATDTPADLYDQYQPMLVEKWKRWAQPSESVADIGEPYVNGIAPLPIAGAITRRTTWVLPGGTVRLELVEGRERPGVVVRFEPLGSDPVLIGDEPAPPADP